MPKARIWKRVRTAMYYTTISLSSPARSYEYMKDHGNCGVKDYMEVDYSSYHRSYRRGYRRNFRIPCKPEKFSGFLFATEKVASITAMIYISYKKYLVNKPEFKKL